MKKRLFIILPAVVIVAACNFLDTYPQDVKTVDASYETVADVQEALTGVYTTLAASQLYGNNMISAMSIMAVMPIQWDITKWWPPTPRSTLIGATCIRGSAMPTAFWRTWTRLRLEARKLCGYAPKPFSSGLTTISCSR